MFSGESGKNKTALRDGVHMATQASDTANSTPSKRARGASPDDLAVVAQRAQAFTNASGVAIALSEGNADEIVCRARSGASAPEVGASLRVEGSFTGLCIQTGKELRCDDCETDTRVDTAAIRALGIRSMVVTPIREDSRVVGVLAAFAPTPHAFTITHVAVLKTMADQISALLQKERRAREENPQADASRPAAPAIIARPVVAPTPAPAGPPAVVIKPSSSAPRAAAPAMAKAETAKSVPLEVVPLATPPKKEERRVDAAPRASFGTFDLVAAQDKKSGSKFMIVGVVAVLVVTAAATFVFLKMQKPKSVAPQQTQEAANIPSATNLPPSTSVQPPSPAASAPATAAVTNAVAVPTTGKPAAEKPAAKTVVEKTSMPPERPAPAEKPASIATLGGSGTSKIARQNSAQIAPEVAPSFTADSANTSAPLSSLARPVASSTPSAAAIEQSQLEPLQVLRTGPLVYPAIAKARGITGPAVVQVTVGKDGKPFNPKFISGQPVFKDAAFQAVMGYQFKPAKLNGQPIEQSTTIKLNFH
ncbi:MAG: putative sensor protein [Candidatus Angelobacter sp.]|nr:putative sensor protein [Candidatus Angelobacter sp.]